MSTTLEAPRGLDTLSPDEQRLMESMRDDTAAPDAATPAPPAAAPPAAPLSTETTEDFEVDVPDEPAPAAGNQRNTMVPHQALHAARVRLKAEETARKELEVQLAAATTKAEKDAAVLQARLEMIAKAMETAPAPAAPAPVAAPVAVADEPMPDKTTDPIGYFEALTGKLQKTVETQGAMLQGFTERQQQAQAGAELRNWGVSQELAFEAREPTYREAMAFLQQSRHDELEAIGVTDATERQRIIANDVNAIAIRAKQTPGANFAERLFVAAQKRGFKKAAPADPTPPAAPAIPPLDADTPVERALRAEAGRTNSLSIGSLGSAPPVRLSAQKIADMSEAEFAVIYDRIKDDPAALRQLMGS